jgi:hypothetical protein
MLSSQLRALAGAVQGAGRPPTPEEQAEMGALSKRLITLARTAAGLVLIALIAMASARFV